MSPPNRGPGFWHRLRTTPTRPADAPASGWSPAGTGAGTGTKTGTGTGADAETGSVGPPLFPPRPVAPARAKGPGLPDWADILSAAPPVADVLAAAAGRNPAQRPPTEAEQERLAGVASLLAAGQIGQAAAALDAALRDRPDVTDAGGRPLYLLESLHIALLLGAEDAAADRALRLGAWLAADDPVIEVLYARAADAAGNRAAARANWQAALARSRDLPEATAWLEAHRASPPGGVAVEDLLGAAGPLPGPVAPPPDLAPPPAEPPTWPDWLPARFLRHALVSVDADGAAQAAAADAATDAPTDAPTGAAASLFDELAILVRHPEGLADPARFGELLIAGFVVQRHLLGHLRPARVYVGRERWALPPGPGEPPPVLTLQAEMLAALWPGVRVTGEHDAAIAEANLLVVDGAAGNAATGTLIGGMMPWVAQWLGDARARAYAACGLPDAAEPPRVAGRRPRAMYVAATPPRGLDEAVQQRLFGLFKTAGYEVAVADTRAMPWRRLVRLAYGADLIAGVHGPALGLALWAHPQTRVLEFFPPGTRRYDRQLLAEATGVPYLGLEGAAEHGFVLRPRERWGPPSGDGLRPIRALPWALLERIFTPPKPPAPQP